MTELSIESGISKEAVFSTVKSYLAEVALQAVEVDNERPWGGFFVIYAAQTPEFINRYFPDLSTEDIARGGKLSPKILVVEPSKRLSWQYHDRREELWKVVSGPVGVIEGTSDVQGPIRTLQQGEIIQHGTQVRHRLVGFANWGVIAEIWQHTDPQNLSDESDIVRVEDDFGR